MRRDHFTSKYKHLAESRCHKPGDGTLNTRIQMATVQETVEANFSESDDDLEDEGRKSQF